jgi:hypothetical protein
MQSVNILVEVYDNVLPCFPRSFDPLEVCVREFSSHASYMLDALGQGAPMMDNGALLALLGWPDSYRTTCLGLGCSDEAMSISTRPCVKTPFGESVPMHGLDLARLVYIDRIRSQLAKAFKNLADIDLLREPEPDGRGRMWTPGVIELFRFLSQQVQLAAGVRDVEVLRNVSGVALQVMQSCASVAALMLAHIQRSGTFDLKCPHAFLPGCCSSTGGQGCQIDSAAHRR